MQQAVLIEKLANEIGVSRKAAGETLKAFIGIVEQALIDGETVPLEGIGKISPVVRSARKGRNPQTGAEIEIPEKRVVKFSPSVTIENRLNGH